jgi:hypothetical protein
MSDDTIDLDQAEQEALAHDVSDETLETAARPRRAPAVSTFSFLTPFCV